MQLRGVDPHPTGSSRTARPAFGAGRQRRDVPRAAGPRRAGHPGLTREPQPLSRLCWGGPTRFLGGGVEGRDEGNPRPSSATLRPPCGPRGCGTCRPSTWTTCWSGCVLGAGPGGNPSTGVVPQPAVLFRSEMRRRHMPQNIRCLEDVFGSLDCGVLELPGPGSHHPSVRPMPTFGSAPHHTQVADPVLFGFSAHHAVDCAAKTIAKAGPDEKVPP